jgi:hypothetical protein
MENTDSLLKQIPPNILADIDAEEDRRVLLRYREAEERGEYLRDSAEYKAAFRRHARTLWEKAKAAEAAGIVNLVNDEVIRLLHCGRERVATLKRHAPVTPALASRKRLADYTDEELDQLSDEELQRLSDEADKSGES